MKWRNIGSKVTKASRQGFLDACEVWTVKPHVVNKRLCAAEILSEETVHIQLSKDEDLECLARRSECERALLLEALCQDVNEESAETNPEAIHVTKRALLPKQPDRWPVLEETILSAPGRGIVVFLPYLRYMENHGKPAGKKEDDISYVFKFDEKQTRIELWILVEEESDHLTSPSNTINCSVEWLQNILFVKIVRWSEEKALNTTLTSLKLIPIHRYNEIYQSLKIEYGQPLAKIWPDGTDPQKFVFEDVAIAAYLITLWEEERKELNLKEKQTFVDLGCGNGLLVHLLTVSGHSGIGLDLRRRKIWDLYKGQADLRECTITPSDEHLFPQYDWLLGNHSDELTPWIPVMAARSSYSTRYFVLPCCLWDFTSKFAEKAHGESQYTTYLNHVGLIGEACGFTVHQDVLRIPSTKRVCFVGRQRTYPEAETETQDTCITEFIERRSRKVEPRVAMAAELHEANNSPGNNNPCGDTHALSPLKKQKTCGDGSQDDKTASWTGEFKAREESNQPRNCVSVDAKIKDKIVTEVFSQVLEWEDKVSITTDSGVSWNRGGLVPLSHVASMFDKPILGQLKKECGGLQTLLRNHHHIFIVRGGCVGLRDWTSPESYENPRNKTKDKGRTKKLDAASLFKTRPCYLYDNHPDGCPLTAEVCRFAHGEDDRRPIENANEKVFNDGRLI